MSEVVMKDLNTVVIDGNPAGCLVDAVLNNRDAAGLINDAFMAWLTQHDADLTAAIKTEAENVAANVAAQHAEQVTDLQGKLKELGDNIGKFLQAAQNWEARYQEAAGANQRLDAKIKELQGQLSAAMNLANMALAGTSEQAVAAARELSRLQLISTQAAVAAQAAEHERLAQTPAA